VACSTGGQDATNLTLSPVGLAHTSVRNVAFVARGRLVEVRVAPQLVVCPAVGWVLSTSVTAQLDADGIAADTQALVVRLFHDEGRSLVRLARLFVDDRDAAEDIVQEAFLRLARHAGRIDDLDRAPAYLRSIVLNLARDHNRRGRVSLRHFAARDREVDVEVDTSDVLVRSEEHRRVLDAVRELPARQRDCITLRYFDELSIDAISATLGVSPNSVKTHLQRAMTTLGRSLEAS
jgi:RNA polymerase sigma factor (sigma-70 family)